MTHLVMTHLVMTTSGCLYDWEVGPPASSSGSSSSSSSNSSSSGGDNDAGPDCAALGAALEMARADAKACMFGLPNQCGASITDERGCKSWVNDGSSAETTAFAEAVAAFNAAECPPSPDPCGLSTPTCLYVAGKPVCVP